MDISPIPNRKERLGKFSQRRNKVILCVPPGGHTKGRVVQPADVFKGHAVAVTQDSARGDAQLIQLVAEALLRPLAGVPESGALPC